VVSSNDGLRTVCSPHLFQKGIPGIAGHCLTGACTQAAMGTNKRDIMAGRYRLHQLPVLIGIRPDAMFVMRYHQLQLRVLPQYIKQHHRVHAARYCQYICARFYCLNLHICG